MSERLETSLNEKSHETWFVTKSNSSKYIKNNKSRFDKNFKSSVYILNCKNYDEFDLRKILRNFQVRLGEHIRILLNRKT